MKSLTHSNPNNITPAIELLLVGDKSWEGLAEAEYETVATTKEKAAGRSRITLDWLAKASRYLEAEYWQVCPTLPQPFAKR